MSIRHLTPEINSLPQEVSRYLNKYSLTGWELESGDSYKTHMAVVIPAIGEYENIRSLLQSMVLNKRDCFNSTLVIFVINNTSSSLEEIKTDNYSSVKLLRNIIKKEPSGDALVNDVISSGLRLALVDASSEGKELPIKDGGVGLARKIGMDLALKIFSYNSPGKNILVCLDADCTIDTNYFTSIHNEFNGRNLDAAVVNYSHTLTGISDQHDRAIICYEIFLRYYVLGLKIACSPYAFHTIGSTMACDHKSYMKIEGMNKRKAAEDFYFMEKLAKNTRIESILSTTVYPSARGSWRVPFGTGQRVNRFLSGMQDEYRLYSPQGFYVLKAWLKVFNDSLVHDSNYYLSHAQQIHPALAEFLVLQGFEADWNRILVNSKIDTQINRQKMVWFDGFRTLKLIHYLRDNAFGPVNTFQALDEIFNYAGLPSDLRWESDCLPPLEIQLKYLHELRRNS